MRFFFVLLVAFLAGVQLLLFAVNELRVYASFKLCFGAQSIPGQAVRHTIMSRIQYQSAGAAVADDIGECPRFHQPPPFLSKPLMNRL